MITLEPDDEPPSALEFSLSRYYPPGTVYFYGFPIGESSHFYNLVPPWKEELVAARPLVCAGNQMEVITFATSLDPDIWEIMTERLGISLLKKENVISFPPEINTEMEGDLRNKSLKETLFEMTVNRKLVMAQPFLHGEINTRYLIDSKIAISMNDKAKRFLYTPEKYLPAQYQNFANGQEFTENDDIPPLPCVVKVASSSAGDGVRICSTKDEFLKAKKDFASLKVRIITEEFIDSVYNFGVQFGIPYDDREIEIIGFNEQLIDKCGGYIGGMIDPNKKIPVLEKIYKVLLEEILPLVKKQNWFGVGGVDILVDKNNDIFLVDPNFRATAATSFLFLNKNKKISKSMVSFIGEFKGTKEDFIKKIVPIAKEDEKNSFLKVVALSKKADSFGINAGILFGDFKELKGVAQHLKELGIEGRALDRVASC